MKDEIREIASKLRPPGHEAAPEVVQAWRWFVALVTGTTALGLTAHILLACGYAAGFGYAGFAQAAELREMKDELAKQRVRSLSREMLDAKQKQCAASGEAKRLYLSSYNDLRVEYFELTRREFPDPPCSDFQ
ncbi:MAG: hypothetical protein ACREB0_00195 [Sphingopyxis sp.]